MGSKDSEFLLAKITVSDLDRSLDFYTRLVGLSRAGGGPPREIDKSARFTEIPLNFSGSLADPFLVIIKEQGLTPTRETAKLTWVGLKVPDVRAAVDRLRAAGYQVRSEPSDHRPGNAFGMVYDPDGYVVEFIQAPVAR